MINCFLTRILQNGTLKRIVNPHHGKYVSLSDARRIGFIVNADIQGSAQAVNELKWELQKRKIDYKGICVDLRKEPQGEPEFLSTPFMSIIHRDNINWYGVPDEKIVTEFIPDHYDILIDLTAGKRLFAVDYILARADASLRIGISQSSPSPYDMFVSMGGDGVIKPEELMRNILIYLTTIHTDSKK